MKLAISELHKSKKDSQNKRVENDERLIKNEINASQVINSRRSSVIDREYRKCDAREQLFDRTKSGALGHNGILQYEAVYNSDEECGSDDEIEKEIKSKNQPEVIAKLKNIDVKIFYILEFIK